MTVTAQPSPSSDSGIIPVIILLEPDMTVAAPPDPGSAPALDPEIIRLEPSHWAELREIRLSALKESPRAFIADVTAEQSAPARTWRDRIRSSTWIAARADGALIGVARLVRVKDRRYVESAWVHPGHRRRGTLRLLINELAARARADGADELLLWVLDSNDAAQDAYLKLGFDLTGTRQPIRDHPTGSWELEMRLRLTWTT